MDADELIAKAVKNVVGSFGYGNEQAIAKEAARLAYLDAAEICAIQALEGECPERAHYCAEAIRAKAAEMGK